MYSCRVCSHAQPSDLACIYVNKIVHDIDELKLINPDVVADPTLPRTTENRCPRCGHKEAVFFQAETRRAEEEMKLYYVCTSISCRHRWTD
jgi:DNA-directed RNA polymerase II subunit RPB9